MFRTVPLPIIRSFSLYAQQWYMSYRFADSLRAGSGQNCSSTLILLASCQQICMTYTIAVCTVKISASSWFYDENFHGTFSEKILRYQIPWKSVQWKPSCYMCTDGRTDRQTDRYDEANSCFSQFCEYAKSVSTFLVCPISVTFRAHLIFVFTSISGAIYQLNLQPAQTL